MNGAPALGDWLDRLRAEYWDRLGEPPGVESCGAPHVVFRVVGWRFAVDATLSRGVVRCPERVRLPGLPPWVLGVVAVRGEIISLTDPALYLRVPGTRAPGQGYVLVLAAGELKAGLWVDRVDDVVQVPDTEVLPVESPWPGCPEGVLRGQWASQRAPALMLDGKRYLAGTAMRVGDLR